MCPSSRGFMIFGNMKTSLLNCRLYGRGQSPGGNNAVPVRLTDCNMWQFCVPVNALYVCCTLYKSLKLCV